MNASQEVVAATGNPHKLEEIRAVLLPLGLAVLSLDEAGGPYPEPDEPGETFEENAAIKAVAYARMTGRTVLADDSGLEVDALQGAPGVHSAYWAGREGSRAERDARNNARLLEVLRSVAPPLRTARFVCAACLASPAGEILLETRGEFEGRIAEAPSGGGGFGYDPLLWLDSHGCTSAELPPQVKNELSHRGKAMRRMAWLIRHKKVLPTA